MENKGFPNVIFSRLLSREHSTFGKVLELVVLKLWGGR